MTKSLTRSVALSFLASVAIAATTSAFAMRAHIEVRQSITSESSTLKVQGEALGVYDYHTQKICYSSMEGSGYRIGWFGRKKRQAKESKGPFESSGQGCAQGDEMSLTLTPKDEDKVTMVFATRIANQSLNYKIVAEGRFAEGDWNAYVAGEEVVIVTTATGTEAFYNGRGKVISDALIAALKSKGAKITSSKVEATWDKGYGITLRGNKNEMATKALTSSTYVVIETRQ